MEETVAEYLSHLNIPISESYLKKSILSHSDYPSLLSVADTLERLGIDHQMGQLKTKSVDQLQLPCIIHLDKGGGQLIFLKDQNDLDTHQSDLEDWDGVVMKVQATDSISDTEHNEQYAKENEQTKHSVVLAVTLLGLLTLSVLQAASWLYLSLFATSVGGAVAGYLLLAKDLGVTYKPVERFCNAGKKTNCDRILNAEDAKLFGFVSFTDAAASYFFFQLLIVGLFIPLFEGTASFLSVLAAASILSLPVIGYSIYYQAVKAQTWCRMCVVVDAILGLQIGLFVQMYLEQIFTLTSVQFVPVLLSGFLYSVVMSSILLLKNRLKTADELRKEVITANRVKHDSEIFTQLLMREEEVDITPFSPEMTLGNHEASIQILMVANLHCNPCRIAFDTVREILASYPEKVGFSLRFTKGMDNTIGDLPASTYLIRYWKDFIHDHNDEEERTQKFLFDWYENMDSETFSSLYPAQEKLNTNGTTTLEAQHYNWVEQQKIVSTPTFFINGYKMPKQYRLKDLMVMLPGIAAQWKSSSIIIKDTTKEIA